MDRELSKYSCYKLYFWKLLHSLINYFFDIYVKKKYNINSNCYLYFKKIGYQNQILLNYINFNETKYFKKLHLKIAKFIINMDTKIPILRINEISIHPKIFNIHRISDLFTIWSNHMTDTLQSLIILSKLYNEISKFAIIEIKSMLVNFDFFEIKFSKVRILKNKNKTRIFVDKLYIFYRGHYLCSIQKLKFSHDSLTGTVNIFAKKMLVSIKNYILKHDIANDMINIINQFKCEGKGTLPNIYFDKIEIQLMIHNHIIFKLHKVIHENNIIKFDGLIKIWKKEIFWIKQCTYNLCDNAINVNDIRVRLFKSTADKLFKTFRPIYKKYYNKKPPKLKSIFKKITNVLPDHGYLNSLCSDELTNSPSVIDGFKLDCKNDYIDTHIQSAEYHLFKIGTMTIDFQDNKGSFVFNNFIYSCLENGLRVSVSKWLFDKNKVIYLDSVDTNSNFVVEYQNNALSIFPYKLYLNMDLDIFSETFDIFTSSISKIVDIFVIHRLHQNYIYDKFYLHSCRIIFSYQTRKLQIFELMSGKYSELINILELNNMTFILHPITITYPKNFSFILSLLINKLLEDIIENNFDTLIKATPISLSYTLTKKITYLTNFARNYCK